MPRPRTRLGSSKRPSKPASKIHRGVLLRRVDGRWKLPSGQSFKTLRAAKAFVDGARAARPSAAQTSSELIGVATVLPIAATTTILAAKL